MDFATSSNVPAVALNDVAKLYGRFAALRTITADFAPGRLYVILGENGAGKSTLLRVIAGLIQPSRGRVLVLGSTNVRTITAHLGYMAHAPMLYDEFAAMENLQYFASLYGLKGTAECEQAIRTVGLDPALSRRVGQYSQGMRQRLSLARAIVHDPKLLLLDEPFSNVDAGSARDMAHLLAQMRDKGKTIFLVTHQPGLLDGVADEWITMSSGRIASRQCELAAAVGVPRAVEVRP